MNQIQIENRHRETHRFLANRYHVAGMDCDRLRMAFWRKMMQMNDCRMIEEMRVVKGKEGKNGR